jgi:hypothetical protein
MNRAQRRALKKQLQGQVGSLRHPVPGSVVLRGGPMDGWIVKPGAPALEPDWRAKYLEAIAAGSYEAAHRPRLWGDATAEDRAGYLDVARLAHGAGRYVVRPDGREADWEAEA